MRFLPLFIAVAAAFGCGSPLAENAPNKTAAPVQSSLTERADGAAVGPLGILPDETGCDGNGRHGWGEACENQLGDGDGCRETLNPVSGEYTCEVVLGYRCSAPNDRPSICTPVECGAGVLDPGEECDDGTYNSDAVAKGVDPILSIG